MEARLTAELPVGPGWQYEPKWDGFRCIAVKSGAAVALQAKSGKPLARYFPEIVTAMARIGRERVALDGEIVIEIGGQLDFNALQQRLHPAASRIAKLSRETPARLTVFDTLLGADGDSIQHLPFAVRRRTLEGMFAELPECFALSPCTHDIRVARRWLESGYAGTDGVIAKRLDLDYRFGERAMQKIKRIRTADCVVGGFRYAQGSRLVGSLLLGLYDDAGLLHHVGFTSALATLDKPALTAKLEAMIAAPGFTGDAPGGPSRWSSERSTQWQPVKPKLVAEVRFDHVTGQRFRHGTRFLRWRPDKRPSQCTFDQLA